MLTLILTKKYLNICSRQDCFSFCPKSDIRFASKNCVLEMNFSIICQHLKENNEQEILQVHSEREKSSFYPKKVILVYTYIKPVFIGEVWWKNTKDCVQNSIRMIIKGMKTLIEFRQSWKWKVYSGTSDFILLGFSHFWWCWWFNRALPPKNIQFCKMILDSAGSQILAINLLNGPHKFLPLLIFFQK